MDLNAQLEVLQKRVNDAVAACRAAATEDRAKLEQRIDKAEVDANLAAKDVQQSAGAALDQAQSKWAQIKVDAAAKQQAFKAKLDKRGDEIDFEAAAADASIAQSDASAAIDLASWAADNARVAVLEALEANAYAAQKAKAVSG